MQVAKENMPVSSVVIGIDLFPIKPIPGCISLVEDITTEKCRQSLTKELQSWKADVVLHDGAPNVGKNWLYDAYQQICLTLQSVKLATQFLRSGGWFITKVFRSKDYNALLWVLKQLFKKVHATKPSASRKESAEIFVVCQYYIAPDKIDPKFLDAKYVFEELNVDGKKPVSLLHPEKKRVKAEGYTDEDFAQRKQLPVSAFMEATSGLSSLQGVSEILFDNEQIAAHSKTTVEIKECCKDIKVLGRKDMKLLLAWWKTIHNEMYPKESAKKVPTENDGEEKNEKKELSKEDIEDMEFEELEKHITELQMEEAKDDKRKKKKIQKARLKLNEKLNLKMVIKGDSGPQDEDIEIFNLQQIRGIADLDALQDQPPDMVLPEHGDNSDNEFKPKFQRYKKDDFHLDDDGRYENHENNSGTDSDSASEDLNKHGLGFSDDDDDDDGNDKKKNKKIKKVAKEIENPLLTDLDTRDKDTKRQQRVQLWFEKDNLKEIDGSEDTDEDFDLDKLSKQYKQKGVNVLGDKTDDGNSVQPFLGKKAKRRARHAKKNDDFHSKSSSSSSSDDSDTADEMDMPQQTSKQTVKKVSGPSGSFEVVSNGTESNQQQPPVKKIKLTEEELALGAVMVQSRKTKRDLIDSAWNRYAFNDENLPDWFVQDEATHMRKEAPVPKELVEEYRGKLQELNVRPIKKVMEAKARKKRRAMKRFEKAKKKAETVLENADSSAQEKMRQIKK